MSPLLADHFLDVATRYADRVAVDVPPSESNAHRISMTYRELAQQAIGVAHALRPHGRRDAIVGICIDRGSPAIYVTQIGAFLSGIAYCYLDPHLPPERLRLLVDDIDPLTIVTDAVGRAKLEAAGLPPRLLADANQLAGTAHDGSRPADAATATDLAYVIHTSGSTGQPKGVLIEHGSVANLIASDIEHFQLGPKDRVAQGSSPAYDSSIEETWLALSVGATVVVMDDETARLGPDLVAWLRREQITVLCPPPTLLRSTQCADPERELPDLRLLYVGGETLPRDIAELWGRGRHLENGYGPTECTVTVLRARIEPGAEITIGHPIRGHTAWVLDEQLQPVAAGVAGELCIAGPGLARGYLNQPDETARCFIQHAQFGRLYRTGDLARGNEDGSFQYLGRIDAQVKIRGHRVELEEIESRLATHDAVHEAACCVTGANPNEQLLAWLVVPAESTHPEPAQLRAFVAQTLPSHMVPDAFGFLEALPRTRGDKLDRSALPQSMEVATAQPPLAEDQQASGAAEVLIEATLRETLGRTEPVATTADFFDELGGNSLLAAIAVSRLREHPSTEHLAVRDIYEARTIRALAARAAVSQQDRRVVSPPVPATTSSWGATIVQSFCLMAAVCAAGPILWVVACWLLPLLITNFGIVALLCLSPWIAAVTAIAWAPIALLLTVVTKRVLIGRYKPAREPAYGSFHVRNWIVQRVVRSVPWGLLQGTVFHCAALRALGAKIGRRVHIHRGVDLLSGGWDLLTVGDNVTVSQDASLRLVDLEAGHLVVGPIVLGDECTVGVRAGVGPASALEAGASLAPLSALRPGATVPTRQHWSGIPARHRGESAPRSEPHTANVLSPALHGACTIFLKTALAALEVLPLTLLVGLVCWHQQISAIDIVEWMFAPTSSLALAALSGVALCGAIPLRLGIDALVCRALGRMPTGTIDRWSAIYLSVWLKAGIVEGAGNWLSGTLFWPVWLRAAGMRVGRGCEISTIIDVIPEHVDIGDECFFADGIYLGGPILHRGTVTLAVTRFGSRTFLGNHVVVAAGERLPDDTLLGICTIADGAKMKAGTSWFGQPAFSLPRREVVTVDRRLTHSPGALRYGNRVFWEILRFALPLVPLLAGLAWFAWIGVGNYPQPSASLLFVHLPLTTVTIAAAVCGLVIALKWLLLGRVQPGQHALWSCWCSRWDFLYVAWGAWARPLLANLEGTLLLPWYLRAMGCRIGRRTLLGGGFAQVVDPDMIDIADGATFHGMFQAHSFEDRVLKTDRVTIGAGATVSAGAVLLYGAHIGQGAQLGPHSVVMKHEHLLPTRHHEGCPTQ
ncbi:MAG: amino acid adenylation domain-containing protein [Planctomycetota bacterium]